MKKRIIKRKRKWIKTSLLAAASLTMAVVMGSTAYAGGTVTYHTHDGNEMEGGACYGTPVYHTHEGDEMEGGKCYATPIYHVHDGNESEGGTCFQTPVYHVHSGDERMGGGCYEEVYHVHSNSCYSEGSHTSSCEYHTEYHPYDCGTVHDWDGDGHGCDGFRAYDCGGHRYLSCGKGNEVTGYRLACGMDTDSVEGYEISCSLTEETIEGYEFDCTMEEGDLEYYENTCGMEEGQAIYHPDSSSGSGDSEDNSGDGSEDSGPDDSGEEVAPTPVILPTPTPTPTATPMATQQQNTDGGGTSLKGNEQKSAGTSLTDRKALPTIMPSVTPEVTYHAETESVTMEPLGTELEETVEPVRAARGMSFFHSPTTRVITLTAGTAVLLGLLAIWLICLFRSVRVFNDNGEGKMQYLGRVRLHLSEEGYYLELTDRLLEKALTNRYMVKTDLFYIGKNSDWEIFILRSGKKKAVSLDKEITFTL